MGSALASTVDRHQRPTIGLLNIGEEVIKGNEIVKQAAELLRGSGLNFYGNVEGDDICKGTVDVIVCDGFVGNVVLKSRSEEHTSELQSLMRISYAVFCLKKKNVKRYNIQVQ